MNLLMILQLVLGTAESLETIFIHNSKSQQTAAVITDDANALLSSIGSALAPAATTSAPKA